MPIRRCSPDEKLALDAQTFSAWGTGLDRDQYLVREQRLRKQRWGARNLDTYLLVGDAGEVLSSCESYRMDSFLDGRPGTTIGIASVFTEPGLRGRGYASRLLTELAPILGAKIPDLHASVLFSDVGKPIYERVGYVARPAEDIVFEPCAGDPAEGVDALIGAGELGAALGRIRHPAGRYVVFPTEAQIDWHLERERTYADLLGHEPLVACGARAGASTMLWMARFNYASMMVLIVESGRADELHALIEAARRVASRAHLDTVTLWSHGADWEHFLDGARRKERDGALPMIHPVARGLEPTEWRFIPRALWV